MMVPEGSPPDIAGLLESVRRLAEEVNELEKALEAIALREEPACELDDEVE